MYPLGIGQCFDLILDRVGLGIYSVGGKNLSQGYAMETLFSVLTIVLGVIKVTFMWLDYKKCKKEQDTDKD